MSRSFFVNNITNLENVGYNKLYITILKGEVVILKKIKDLLFLNSFMFKTIGFIFLLIVIFCIFQSQTTVKGDVLTVVSYSTTALTISQTYINLFYSKKSEFERRLYSILVIIICGLLFLLLCEFTQAKSVIPTLIEFSRSGKLWGVNLVILLLGILSANTKAPSDYERENKRLLDLIDEKDEIIDKQDDYLAKSIKIIENQARKINSKKEEKTNG